MDGRDDTNSEKYTDDINTRLRQLRNASGSDVVRVGKIPGCTISSWANHVTDDLIITGERRQHYLDRHPEVEAHEGQLIKALLDPSEIHVNASDPHMAIVYNRISETLFLRVTVWISDRRDRQNSVLSMRRARLREVENGRISGRLRWKK